MLTDTVCEDCKTCPTGTYQAGVECNGTSSKDTLECIECRATCGTGFKMEGVCKGNEMVDTTFCTQVCFSHLFYMPALDMEKINSRVTMPVVFQCPEGTYNKWGNTSECTQCSPGTYSEAGSAKCTACAYGKYAEAGASGCLDCAAWPCENGQYRTVSAILFHTSIGTDATTYSLCLIWRLYSQTCMGSSGGECVQSPKITAVDAWDAPSVQNFEFNESPSVLPAVYNHRMTKINLTAYSFGGIDGKFAALEFATLMKTSTPLIFSLLYMQNHLSA
jgi:hypothetical protein